MLNGLCIAVFVSTHLCLILNYFVKVKSFCMDVVAYSALLSFPLLVFDTICGLEGSVQKFS